MFKKVFLLFLLTILVVGCLPTGENTDGDNSLSAETVIDMIGSAEKLELNNRSKSWAVDKWIVTSGGNELGTIRTERRDNSDYYYVWETMSGDEIRTFKTDSLNISTSGTFYNENGEETGYLVSDSQWFNTRFEVLDINKNKIGGYRMGDRNVNVDGEPVWRVNRATTHNGVGSKITLSRAKRSNFPVENAVWLALVYNKQKSILEVSVNSDYEDFMSTDGI